MPSHSANPIVSRSRVNRREFLKQTGGGLGAAVAVASAGRGRASAQTASPYPDWIPASPKPPKRGGVLTRASPGTPR